jgi:hypothetical protein
MRALDLEMEKLLSLHKHWITADAIKQVIFTDTDYKANDAPPENMMEYAKMHSAFSRMAVMYGLIYVVIEGYRELDLNDSRIDELLEDEKYLDHLRLFRNATFHYQKKPVSEKELKFLEAEGAEHWIRELHYSFQSYFERVFPINEVMKLMKDGKI